MAKPSPPRIEPDEVPKRTEDEIERFLERFYYRIYNNVAAMDQGDLNAHWVAFEALEMIVSAMSAGLRHEDIKGSYPIETWRTDTVEVPYEVLRAVIDPWSDYTQNSKTLGQSFGFEKLNRQGAKSMKAKQRKLDETRKISNAVLTRYTQIGESDPASLEAVTQEVAEEFGVSARTAGRAYKKFGARTFAALKNKTEHG